MDLFAGCGGLSIGLENAGIVVTHSVEFNEDAAATYRKNSPHTNVLQRDVDELLQVCKNVYRIRESIRIRRTLRQEAIEHERRPKAKIIEQQMLLTEGDDEIENVFVVYEDVESDDDTRVDEYFDKDVKFVDGLRSSKIPDKQELLLYFTSGSTAWVMEDLCKCDQATEQFLNEKYGHLPMPGQIDFIAGGPPCQGFSRLNRHSDLKNAWKNEKNRMMLTYLEYVSFFKPKYMLIENVCSIQA